MHPAKPCCGSKTAALLSVICTASESSSCGTGACATAVAAALTDKAGRTSQIVMDGGTLNIEWCEADRSDGGRFFQKNHVYMTGPAAFVFDGELEQ